MDEFLQTFIKDDETQATWPVTIRLSDISAVSRPDGNADILLRSGRWLHTTAWYEDVLSQLGVSRDDKA